MEEQATICSDCLATKGELRVLIIDKDGACKNCGHGFCAKCLKDHICPGKDKMSEIVNLIIEYKQFRSEKKDPGYITLLKDEGIPVISEKWDSDKDTDP